MLKKVLCAIVVEGGRVGWLTKLAIFLRFEIGHPVHLAFAKLKIKCEKSRCFVGKQPKNITVMYLEYFVVSAVYLASVKNTLFIE